MSDITKTIVCVENMSINQEIPNEDLLNDLLSEEDGDETTNRVRKLIKQRYSHFQSTSLTFNSICLFLDSILNSTNYHLM